jgi:hypothetical protein
MRFGWVTSTRRVLRHHVKTPRRLLSTQPQHDLLSKATRNIGIIAHIDAVSHVLVIGWMQSDLELGEDDDDRAHALL